MKHDPPRRTRPRRPSWLWPRRRRVGILPFGEIDQLCALGRADWIRLDPHQPILALLCDVLAADPHADIPADWQARLVEAALDGRSVVAVSELWEAATGRVAIGRIDEIRFRASAYLRVKALLDRLLAVAVLPGSLVILAVVALAIRIDSPGPILFRQARVGLRGRRFAMWKFRTMLDRPPTGRWDDMITGEGDWRVTRFGAFLRRSRLDELPQILNILAGDMSWIGPRPEAEILSTWYAGEIPLYRHRHLVRPGISGWAQVNQGHVAGVEEVHTKLQYDFYYIKYFSPWLDFLIACRTVKTMVTGFGAK